MDEDEKQDEGDDGDDQDKDSGEEPSVGVRAVHAVLVSGLDVEALPVEAASSPVSVRHALDDIVLEQLLGDFPSPYLRLVVLVLVAVSRR